MGDPIKQARQSPSRIRLIKRRPVLFIWLAAGGYVVCFATVDSLLEAYADTPHQLVSRLVLIALATLAVVCLLVHLLQPTRQSGGAYVCIDAARLHGALLRFGNAAIPSSNSAAASTATPVDTALATMVAAAQAEASSVLTRREREVARLIAQGHTSREIAEELVITERTADTHADRIRAKLGLRSRADIAAWMLGAGIADIH